MFNREEISKCKTLVVKIGSGVLSEPGGLAHSRIKALAGQIMAEHKRGRQVVVVSSGAIAAGFKKVGLKERPKTVRLKQACAAVGQLGLMAAWEKALNSFGGSAAQVLLTAEDLAARHRFLNAKSTLTALLEWRIIPVINENDTVAVEELKVGDNDTLGALVSGLVEADLFINLTDLDGLYEADPRKNPEARLISEVEKVTPKILALAGGSGGPLGTGGMFTKVRAAKRLSERGQASLIANGLSRNVINRIMDGEDVGTFFKPQRQHLAGKKYWLAFASRPKGSLTIDQGAAQALTASGKSLLPRGIIEVDGVFSRGDAVTILGPDGGQLAVGLANYSAAQVEKIMGRRSQDIEKLLGFCHSEEVVHRDHLVLAEGLV